MPNAFNFSASPFDSLTNQEQAESENDNMDYSTSMRIGQMTE